jgi:hypothetical protein
MSCMQLETCWAFNKLWNNKFYYKVASCWLFLLIHTMMHVSINIKKLHNIYYYYFFNDELQPIRLIVRSGLDFTTFATRRLHACHQARARSGGKWNCGREISGKFYLNVDFHVTFRDLSYAVKLRHGTDGCTSSPKEGVLRIFSP